MWSQPVSARSDAHSAPEQDVTNIHRGKERVGLSTQGVALDAADGRVYKAQHSASTRAPHDEPLVEWNEVRLLVVVGDEIVLAQPLPKGVRGGGENVGRGDVGAPADDEGVGPALQRESWAEMG
jgi:hypothetical protein